MKILLSAYACEPNKGSEPYVGWNWSRELTKRNHEVWVLTRSNNQKVIDDYYSNNSRPENLFFIYYDLPNWAKKWKKGQTGVRFYYLLWQWFAYRFVKKIHAKQTFDCVHHVTFVSVRQPSFMGGLGIPFVFGPVAGGEKAPWRLRFSYGSRGFIIDGLRDIANFLIKLDPLMQRTFKKAHKIFVTSNQTKELIPKKYHQKTKNQLAIGIDLNYLKTNFQQKKTDSFNILYMGRFLHWKGMDMGIRAFALLLKNFPNARLTMVGKGREEKKWRYLTEKLEISEQVSWIPWVEKHQTSALFTQHDLFLFPSLHDSGGLVVLEAMAHGLPVICLDIGGPKMIVNNSCGTKIPVLLKSENEIINNLATAIEKLISDKDLHEKLSKGAMSCSMNHSWSAVIQNVYSSITVNLKNNYQNPSQN